MQRVTDMGLLGIVRPKIAPRTTTDPGMGTLTLAQAQRIANPSAAQGTTSPTSAHRAAPINGAPVPSMGKRRNTSVGDSFPTFPVATGVPPTARRDDENGVFISEAQSKGFLPNGRYRIKHDDGRITTIEVGGGWCSEGLRLVRTRKGIEAAQKRLEREKMIQDDLFGSEVR